MKPAPRRSLLRAATLAIGLGAAGVAAAEPPGSVTLEGPATVQDLLREDVTGDGVADLLALEGRTIWIWAGRRGALPDPKAIQVALPPDVSLVDVEGPGALIALGPRGLERVPVPTGGPDGDAPAGPLPHAQAPRLPWRDVVRASFVDLVRGDLLLLPDPRGWRVGRLAAPGRGSTVLEVEPFRSVTAPGRFLEDATKAEDGLPQVFVGVPFPGARGEDGSSLWSLSGDRLLGSCGGRRVSYDVSFLPATGERRLVDMDRDGVPDLVHGDGTNQEARIAFFRTPPPPEGPDGGSLKPALAYLHLTGYPLLPVTTDLDGDGRTDFLMTSIEIDTKNVVRALGGKVTAHTRAFLNRRREGMDRFFGAEPDAVVTSDIGVRIRFGYTGNIDIQRSFTIVGDGDYDGDGRRDLVIREGSDTLRVRRGSAEGVWEPEGRRVQIPALGAAATADAFAGDLTGDGRDELTLVYRRPLGGGTEPERVVVLDLR